MEEKKKATIKVADNTQGKNSEKSLMTEEQSRELDSLMAKLSAQLGAANWGDVIFYEPTTKQTPMEEELTAISAEMRSSLEAAKRKYPDTDFSKRESYVRRIENLRDRANYCLPLGIWEETSRGWRNFCHDYPLRAEEIGVVVPFIPVKRGLGHPADTSAVFVDLAFRGTVYGAEALSHLGRRGGQFDARRREVEDDGF